MTQADNNPKTEHGNLKPPMHLVPPVAMLTEAEVFRLGAHKYGPYNWREKSVAVSVYYSAAMRHMMQYWDGEDSDSESKQSHLAHARACMAILIDATANANLVDDRPPAGGAGNYINRERDHDATTSKQPYAQR